MTDRANGSNDPGADAAGARAADVENAAATPIEVGSGGHIRIGTASWTDPTMTATGVFYPTSATTAEERLQHYASTFPLVEVDATYYALPSAATAKLWVERTPPDFVFDIKAHALMTGQGTETKRLPKALRSELPEPVATKARIYAKDLPPDVLDEVWATVPGRPRAAGGSRPAGLDPAPVPALVLPVVGEPRGDRGGRRAPGGDDLRGRVPQRLVAQREERRADARVPRGQGARLRDGRRAAGLQEQRPAGHRGDLGSRAGPLPRPQPRDLGGQGDHAGRALPLPLLARRAGGMGAADPTGGERGEGHACPDEQLLRELRHDQRPRDRGDPGRRPGGLREPRRSPQCPRRSGDGTSARTQAGCCRRGNPGSARRVRFAVRKQGPDDRARVGEHAPVRSGPRLASDPPARDHVRLGHLAGHARRVHRPGPGHVPAAPHPATGLRAR